MELLQPSVEIYTYNISTKRGLNLAPFSERSISGDGGDDGGCIDIKTTIQEKYHSGDITSTRQQVSPPETTENYIQDPESGDSGDSGGSIPTLEMEVGNTNSRPLPGRYVAFDFEWLSIRKQPIPSKVCANMNTHTQITGAAFIFFFCR